MCTSKCALAASNFNWTTDFLRRRDSDLMTCCMCVCIIPVRGGSNQWLTLWNAPLPSQPIINLYLLSEAWGTLAVRNLSQITSLLLHICTCVCVFFFACVCVDMCAVRLVCQRGMEVSAETDSVACTYMHMLSPFHMQTHTTVIEWAFPSALKALPLSQKVNALITYWACVCVCAHALACS